MERDVKQYREENAPILKNGADFNALNYQIIFAPEEGFEVKTTEVRSRREKGETLPLTDSEKEALAAQMRGGHARYIRRVPAEAALRAFRQDRTEENAEIFRQKRQEYQDHFSIEAGLRKIDREDNTISLEVKPVSFPPYNLLKEAPSKEQLEFSAISSTTMTLITSDNKLLIQHRSPSNSSFGDVPGASASGYFDIQWDRTEKKRRMPKSVTTESVINNANSELYQEIGLEEKYLDSVLISGIVFDNNFVHEELLLNARTHLTSEEVKQKTITREERKMNSEEFDEKYIFIDATPEAIATLLTRVKCPIPTTHQAAYVTCGYRLMLEREGVEAANEWKNAIEIGVEQNMQEINRIVAEFSAQKGADEIPERLLLQVASALEQYTVSNPQASENDIEAFRQLQIRNLPVRKKDRYDPNFLPSEQGLPSFEEALRQEGLIL